MLLVEQNAALALDARRPRLPDRDRPARDGRPAQRDLRDDENVRRAYLGY